MGIAIDTSAPLHPITSYCSTHDTNCVCVALQHDEAVEHLWLLWRVIERGRAREAAVSRMHSAYRSRTLRRSRR